jgi:hypothetical protein
MIHRSGTFEYEAEFTENGFSESGIILYGSDLSGGKIDRLVGHKPTIRFSHDRVVLVASEQSNSNVRNVSFAIGDAVPLSARPGDRLNLVRTGSGGIGLSLLRQDRLILAAGAVTAIPLGTNIQAKRDSLDEELWETPNADTWLDFRVGSEQSILRGRDVSVIGNYHIYIERCWRSGLPGTDECVAISLGEDSAMKLAAMRSAILLGNGVLKMTRWDCTEIFCSL